MIRTSWLCDPRAADGRRTEAAFLRGGRSEVGGGVGGDMDEGIGTGEGVGVKLNRQIQGADWAPSTTVTIFSGCKWAAIAARTCAGVRRAICSVQ